MIPEPTTPATRKAVPVNSAVRRRTRGGTARAVSPGRAWPACSAPAGRGPRVAGRWWWSRRPHPELAIRSRTRASMSSRISADHRDRLARRIGQLPVLVAFAGKTGHTSPQPIVTITSAAPAISSVHSLRALGRRCRCRPLPSPRPQPGSCALPARSHPSTRRPRRPPGAAASRPPSASARRCARTGTATVGRP